MTIRIPLLLLLAIFIYRAPSLAGAGILDPDYYWHVSYGEWILANNKLPTSDFWSWTFAGENYRLTQWLGEVVMAVANNIGGLRGTSTLAALLATLAIAASYRAARIYLDNRLAALAIAVCCNAILLSLACRPHQFTHLGLALLTWIVASYQAGNNRAIYWTPLLMALWVNLHGGYAFGLVSLGLVSGTWLVDAYLKQDYETIRSRIVPLILASFAGFLATLANPYGWHAWEYAIEIANLKSSSAGIVDEWAVTSIKTEPGIHFFAVSAAVIAAMATAAKRPALGTLLMALALIAIGWSAVRLSLMATVLLVPILAASLRDTPFYQLAFTGQAAKYDRTVPLWAASLSLMLIAGASWGLSSIDRTVYKLAALQLPQAEGEFLRSQGLLDRRILNTPETGGYLIRTHGARVAMDTRLDLYGDRLFFEFLFARRGEAGWREFVDRLDPDVVLINNQAALRQLLTDTGKFRAVFEGPSYSVLIRTLDREDLPTVPLSQPSKLVLNQLKS